MRRAELAFLAAAGAWLAALLPASPAWAAAPTGPLYLPVLYRPPEREPCGPPATDQCGTGADQAWQLVCGGFGRVRDLVVPVPVAPGAPVVALAVGDGVARLTVADSPAAEPGYRAQWEPQVGQDLTGLNALTYDLDPAADGIQGWAAGEGDRIATLRAGCWRMEDTYREQGVTLTSIHTDRPGGGWAVGRRQRLDDEGGVGSVGVLRGLVQPPAGPPFWAQYTGLAQPPPLLDVYYTYARSTETSEAWAVGIEGDEGVFLQGLPLAGAAWSWREVVRRPGLPRELTLRSLGAEGWAFGAGQQAGQPGVATWRYQRGARLWEQDSSLFQPGRTLVDVYSASDVGTERLWVGLSPARAEPVLARLLLDAERRWELVGVPPDDLPATAVDGNRAIGPMSNGAVLYAWDDAVWLYRGGTPTPAATVTARPGGSPTATPGGGATATAAPGPTATPTSRGGGEESTLASWALLRRARPLQAFVPGALGEGWAIAEAGDGSAVLVFRGQAFQVQSVSAGRLNAMAGDSATAWAVGQAGLTLRLAGGRVQALNAGQAAGAELLAVAATTAGTLWAAGVGPDGYGRLWRRDPAASGWLETARTGRPGALRAVAALADGHAWAVGDGCLALIVGPDGTALEAPPCAGNTEPVDLAAVAATAADAAWAGGSYYVYRWDGRQWTVMRSADGGTALDFLATGEHLTQLAALPPSDVWGVYRAAGPQGREASTTIRLRGDHWQRGTLFNVPVTDLRLVEDAAGQRSVWLAGHGSTLAHRAYAPAGP